MMKKWVAVTLCTIMLLLMVPYSAYGAGQLPSGFEKVGESERLVLYYRSEKSAIAVEDKQNGYVWSSAVSEQDFNMEGLSDLWQTGMNTLFNFGYNNLSEATNQIIPTNALIEKSEMKMEKVQNGVRLDYKFLNLGIEVGMDIQLEDDSLSVRFPKERIHEKGQYGLVYIEPMPFFGAAGDEEDGYAFYPDGSGALAYFKKDHPEFIENYSQSVYGLDIVDFEAYFAIEMDGRKQVMLPAFGLKRKDNAFIGYVSEGEHDSYINFSPSGYRVNLNRISAQFTYRRVYRATRPNTALVDRMENEILLLDHGVKYAFLAGDQANYSGMANRCRKYLIDEGKIKPSIKPGDSMPMALDLLTGIKEYRLLFSKFIPMTTFQQAKDIMTELQQQGIQDLQVNLMGWTKEGLNTYPLHWPPSRWLGGAKGLKDLAQFSKKQDIDLFLQDNFIDAWSQNKGFSIQNDVIRQKNSLVASDMSRTMFMFSPIKAWDYYSKKYLPRMNDYAISGLNFEKFGSLLYFDYNKSRPVNRQQTAELWERFIKQSKEKFGMAASSGGNAYVLPYVDRLMDIPVEDSGYFFTDETIPFYQMVVHGLIPYSSRPFNLFYDPPMQKLKAVEYGCLPYYQLTYQTADQLKYTSYNELFTSSYKEWKGRAIETTKELQSRLQSVYAQQMIEHKKLQNNVYKVSYGNGMSIYINYDNKPVQIEGHEIKAMDYLVVDKEGKAQ